MTTYGAPTCPNDCSGQGTCDIFNGKVECNCEEGFTGVDCSTTVPTVAPTEAIEESTAANTTAPSNATAAVNGTASNSTAAPRFMAQHAEVKSREIDLCVDETCGDHGECKNNMCFCYPGFSGDKCGEEEKCPKDCHGSNGECLFGTCVCAPGYSGADCGEEAPAAAVTEVQKCDTKRHCDPIFAECGSAGICQCLPGISHPSCQSETVSCDSLVTNESNVLRSDNVAGGTQDAYSVSSVAMIVGGAFAGGLLIGLVLQMVASMRQRSKAKAILEEEEAATFLDYSSPMMSY